MTRNPVATLLILIAGSLGCGSGDHPDFREVGPHLESSKHFPTIVAPAPGILGVTAPELNPGPESVSANTVACSRCHATRKPNLRNNSESLKEFHGGLSYAHGGLSCLSCHNSDNYEQLRRADGTALEFAEVKDLCSQCHGPQARDYENGAHGGGAGFWDSTRGPLLRNNCVHCHDPHSPAFGKMQPTFKPRDRFLGPHESGTSR